MEPKCGWWRFGARSESIPMGRPQCQTIKKSQCSRQRTAALPLRPVFLYDSDFYLTKPSTDILLHGHAYAPGGGSTTHVDVTMRVGDVSKTLRVTGDVCTRKPCWVSRWDRHSRSVECRSLTNARMEEGSLIHPLIRTGRSSRFITRSGRDSRQCQVESLRMSNIRRRRGRASLPDSRQFHHTGISGRAMPAHMTRSGKTAVHCTRRTWTIDSSWPRRGSASKGALAWRRAGGPGQFDTVWQAGFQASLRSL